MNGWPKTYRELRETGLGEWVVDWLELSMSIHGESAYAELKVVQAFLYLMSRRDTQESLAKAEGPLGAFKAMVQRLRKLSVEAPVTKPENVDLTLIESMVTVLSGMTASAWPDRVFAMGGTVDEVTDVREPASA